MHVISNKERKKRGCEYCTESELKRVFKDQRRVCNHEECPYEVLDKYETYEEFMESEDSKIVVNEFFSSTAQCYELAKCNTSPKRLFSDGDQRTCF